MYAISDDTPGTLSRGQTYMRVRLVGTYIYIMYIYMYILKILKVEQLRIQIFKKRSCELQSSHMPYVAWHEMSRETPQLVASHSCLSNDIFLHKT